MSENKENFSPELMEYIKEWKEKPGNVIMVLHKVQGEFGYVSREAAEQVSEMIDVPFAKIWGVLTFYHFFKLTKPGDINIQVCLGTACYLKGGETLVDEIQNQLGIGIGEVTPDGRYSLEAVRCIGCCGLAPVMTVGGEVFGKVTKKKVAGILAGVSAQ